MRHTRKLMIAESKFCNSSSTCKNPDRLPCWKLYWERTLMYYR